MQRPTTLTRTECGRNGSRPLRLSKPCQRAQIFLCGGRYCLLPVSGLQVVPANLSDGPRMGCSHPPKTVTVSGCKAVLMTISSSSDWHRRYNSSEPNCPRLATTNMTACLLLISHIRQRHGRCLNSQTDWTCVPPRTCEAGRRLLRDTTLWARRGSRLHHQV